MAVTLDYAAARSVPGRCWRVGLAIGAAVVSAGLVAGAMIYSKGYVDNMFGHCGVPSLLCIAKMDAIGWSAIVPMATWTVVRGDRVALRIARTAALGSLAAVIPAVLLVHGGAEWFVRR